jgi:hypothetical protein
MRKLIALMMLVSGAAQAADLTMNAVPTLCGNGTSGSCDVYNDGVTVYRWYWYWGGTYGNASLTQYGIDSAGTRFVEVTYKTNLTASPRGGVSNIVLVDPLGSTVGVSYAGHTTSTLIRSGHNFYSYKTYVDSGSVTTP